MKTRISIHEKYSANKQGFGNWIFEQYNISENNKVLELGCGNGVIWKDNYHKLPPDVYLILSDFSEGMLTEAKNNIIKSDTLSFQQIDIQNIPLPDNGFDIVIANMMLYHVPDLNKGLSEVRRVLKKDGTFYCATYGEHGIIMVNLSGVSKNELGAILESKKIDGKIYVPKEYGIFIVT